MSSMSVTFAGSGDAFGSGGRLQACIVVQADEQPPILLDCGATSLVALKRQGIDPNLVATGWFRICTWTITVAFHS